MAEIILVRGLAEAKRRMAAFPERLQRRILGQALRAGATSTAQAIRKAAPRGTRPYTKKERKYRAKKFNLSRSIGTKGGIRGNPGETIVQARLTGRGFYGRFIEFGAKNVARRPWFAPAAIGNADTAAQIVLRKMQSNIDLALKG